MEKYNKASVHICEDCSNNTTIIHYESCENITDKRCKRGLREGTLRMHGFTKLASRNHTYQIFLSESQHS
jgi:hypothetical protein